MCRNCYDWNNTDEASRESLKRGVLRCRGGGWQNRKFVPVSVLCAVLVENWRNFARLRVLTVWGVVGVFRIFLPSRRSFYESMGIFASQRWFFLRTFACHNFLFQLQSEGARRKTFLLWVRANFCAILVFFSSESLSQEFLIVCGIIMTCRFVFGARLKMTTTTMMMMWREKSVVTWEFGLLCRPWPFFSGEKTARCRNSKRGGWTNPGLLINFVPIYFHCWI